MREKLLFEDGDIICPQTKAVVVIGSQYALHSEADLGGITACLFCIAYLQIFQLQPFILLPVLLLKTFLITGEEKKISMKKEYTVEAEGNYTREIFSLLQKSVGGS